MISRYSESAESVVGQVVGQCLGQVAAHTVGHLFGLTHDLVVLLFQGGDHSVQLQHTLLEYLVVALP